MCAEYVQIIWVYISSREVQPYPPSSFEGGNIFLMTPYCIYRLGKVGQFKGGSYLNILGISRSSVYRILDDAA